MNDKSSEITKHNLDHVAKDIGYDLTREENYRIRNNCSLRGEKISFEDFFYIMT
jgi:hypothetical protein